MTKWRVLITCPQMQVGLDEYRTVFAEQGIEVDTPTVVQQLSEADLAGIIDRYDGMIAGDDPLTASVLERAQRLRVISKWGVGIDNIDLEAARSRSIRVTNTPGAFGDEVADVVVGYLVLLARGLHQIDARVRAGEWPKIEGASLAGKTLGIVGLGSIGRALATRAGALGLLLLGHDVSENQRVASEALGVQTVPLGELLRQADFVSLNCPLTANNHHMLGEREFRLMKRGARLINTARGQLVDEGELVQALEEGRLAGAALDVFEVEPLPLTSRLRSFSQVILGAHNGSNTSEAVRRVSDMAVQNLIEGLKDEG
ncbi:MAG: phosphoglycerate dehydrogenase [Candidatus Limnocylindrales bacterium]|nr:phosphoglycerate dehydrogenase [Candidatus Limnocylindrales bacterium]